MNIAPTGPAPIGGASSTQPVAQAAGQDNAAPQSFAAELQAASGAATKSGDASQVSPQQASPAQASKAVIPTSVLATSTPVVSSRDGKPLKASVDPVSREGIRSVSTTVASTADRSALVQAGAEPDEDCGRAAASDITPDSAASLLTGAAQTQPPQAACDDAASDM